MVVLREFRIPMPMSVEEYQTAQLYMTAKSTRMEADRENGAKVEVLKNELCEHPQYGKGQFTLKVYHMHNKLPGWLRALVPKKKAVLREESYNCYPHIETTLTLDMFSKFKVVIRSEHRDGQTDADNVHNLSKKELKTRTVEYVDIAMDKMPKDSTAALGNEDPTKTKSHKTMRGPLKKNWQSKSKPLMCAYKLVRAEFDYFGLRSRVEGFVLDYEKDLFLSSHKQMFCWMDQWYGLSMNQIRQIEAEEILETNAAAKRTNSIDAQSKGAAASAAAAAAVPAPPGGKFNASIVPHYRVDDDQTRDAAFEDDISDGDDDEAEERLLSRQPRGMQPPPNGSSGRRPPPPPPQSAGTIAAAGVGLKQPGTGDLDAYLAEQEQKRAAAAAVSSVMDENDIDDIESDDGEEEEQMRTQQHQQQHQQRGPVPGKKQGLMESIAGKMAGVAVSQMAKHTTAETWEGKYGIKQNGKEGEKKKKGHVEEEESDDDSEEEDARGRQRGAGGKTKKKQAEEEELPSTASSEDDDDELDSDDDEVRKPGKQGRLCQPGGLFGSKSSWVALCNGARKDDDMAGDMSSSDDSDAPKKKKKGRDRDMPSQRKSAVPSWGETISSMNWSQAQWKIQHESDRLGRKMQQKSVEAIESVVAGSKAMSEKVDEIRQSVTGARDASYPLYKGDDR